MSLLENKVHSFSNILKIHKSVTYIVKKNHLMELYSEFEEWYVEVLKGIILLYSFCLQERV